MDTLLKLVQTVNTYLTDYILIFLLLGTGLFFTIKTRFVQVRCFGEGMHRVFGNLSLFGKKHESGLTSFQALATAVAAQVGTGNIVGASGAILAGGPGAIFWMWVIAFFGMATIYAEATLAQTTRVVNEDGEVHGGPVYYIKTAFKGGFGKFLSVFFAIAITLALGFMGSMVQSNSIAGAVSEVVSSKVLFNIGDNAVTVTSLVVGIILALISAFIFIGGIQRIASVTEKLVPLMAVLFLAGGVLVLVFNITSIPGTIAMIFKYAFTPQALIGGAFGAAIKTAVSQGAKRGLFSNEAGMGSTPHAHAMANVEKPHDQGVVAMIGVFIDTFVVLTMTALVVITTLYSSKSGLLHGLVGADYVSATTGADAIVTKGNAMQIAFTSGLPTFFGKFGAIFVAICLFFFAFSTIISWNFFGKINVQSLFKNNKVATVLYSIIAVTFIFLGSILSNDLVWELTDFFNYLMVLPNVIALWALYKVVVKCSQSNKKK